MALRKPSDFFGKSQEENSLNTLSVDEGDGSLREELNKVESLSEQVIKLQQELSQKVVKNDLESLILSQINSMQENFEYLQNDFRKSNKKDISEFKNKVSELTEIVGNLVENELPKYKKQVTKNELNISEKLDTFKEDVKENITDIRYEVDTKVNSIVEVIDESLGHFNSQLQETSSEVKRTADTYNKLSKIVESKVSKENEKLEEYSQVIQSLYETFVELEENLQKETSSYLQIIEEKFETISSDVNDKIDILNEEVKSFEDNVSAEVSNIKADVVINEQHIKNVDKYLQENHQELVTLREEVFAEIEQIPVGNLQENLERLEQKIDYIKETYSKIEPEVIVKEVIQEGLLNIPPEEKTSDPLSPLNQNFVTLDQLQNHYKLFINRIQQQLSTLGGGGEYRFRFLDGIVGIKTNPDAYDGKYLKWNSTTQQAEFSTVSGGGGTQTLNQTLGYGNTSSLGMSVGVITATYFVGDGSLLTNVPGSANSGYANTAGIATYATSSGISTYATSAGIATYSSTSGIATYATSSGIATYSSTAGISTYSSTAGIATTATSASTAYGLSGTPNLNVGVVTATSYSGSGTNLTGIVTSIVAGTNITISGSTGQVTINSSGGGTPTYGGYQPVDLLEVMLFS